MAKGEISMNVIVMAVIALLILVVLAFITLRNTGNFSDGIAACSRGSDYCVTDTSRCAGFEQQFNTPFVPVKKSCRSGNTAGSDSTYCCEPIGSVN